MTTSASSPGGKARSKWRRRLVAGAAGALVGLLLAKQSGTHRASPFVPGSPMAFCCYSWIALSLYWSLEARKASVAESAESTASRNLHLLLVNAAFILSFWPYPGWPNVETRFFTFPRVLPPAPFLEILGVFVQAGSFLLAVWARRQLGRNWSGEVTLKVDHELIRNGPYRRIRHPIYTGAIGMYVGPALVGGRLQGILALALIAIAYTRKIRMEERVLREEFGVAYEEYRRESRAVIPWVV